MDKETVYPTTEVRVQCFSGNQAESGTLQKSFLIIPICGSAYIYLPVIDANAKQSSFYLEMSNMTKILFLKCCKKEKAPRITWELSTTSN